MANNSIGDFYVNIMPRFDEKNVGKGSAKIGGMTKGLAALTAGIGAAGAGLFSFVSGAAATNKELQRSANILGISSEELKQNRMMFQLVGGDAKAYDETIKSLMTTIESAKFGEADFRSLGMAGFDIKRLKDPKTAMDEMRKTFSRMTAQERVYWASKLGISEDALLVLTQNNKEYAKNSKIAKDRLKLTEKENENLEDLYQSNQNLSTAYGDFKMKLAAQLAPGQLGISKKFIELLKDKDVREGMVALGNAISKAFGLIGKAVGAYGKSLKAAKDFGEDIGEMFYGISDPTKQAKEDIGRYFLAKEKIKGSGLPLAQQAVILKGAREKAIQTSQQLSKQFNINVNVTGSENEAELTEKMNRVFRNVVGNLDKGVQ